MIKLCSWRPDLSCWSPKNPVDFCFQMVELPALGVFFKTLSASVRLVRRSGAWKPAKTFLLPIYRCDMCQHFCGGEVRQVHLIWRDPRNAAQLFVPEQKHIIKLQKLRVNLTCSMKPSKFILLAAVEFEFLDQSFFLFFVSLNFNACPNSREWVWTRWELKWNQVFGKLECIWASKEAVPLQSSQWRLSICFHLLKPQNVVWIPEYKMNVNWGAGKKAGSHLGNELNITGPHFVPDHVGLSTPFKESNSFWTFQNVWLNSVMINMLVNNVRGFNLRWERELSSGMCNWETVRC